MKFKKIILSLSRVFNLNLFFFLQLVLLDFGACRSYEKSFMDQYIVMINAAGDNDRAKVLELSRKMGFLTGYESKVKNLINFKSFQNTIL